MSNCSVEGCNLAARSKGLCAKHYNRQWERDHPEYKKRRKALERTGPSGVPCPYCENEKSAVLDSRGNKRRRKCLACGQRFTTYENLRNANEPLPAPELTFRQFLVNCLLLLPSEPRP